MQLPTIYDLRTGVRRIISAGSAVLPREAGIRAERWFRGYEDAKKLENADGVIVSFGKSGRTWLRVLVWRYFAKKNGYACGRDQRVRRVPHEEPERARAVLHP